jgi:hypothetical protein
VNERGSSERVGARTIKQSVGGIYFRETTSLNEKESLFLIEGNLCVRCAGRVIHGNEINEFVT